MQLFSTSTSKHPKRLSYHYREFISVQDSTICFNKKENDEMEKNEKTMPCGAPDFFSAFYFLLKQIVESCTEINSL